MLTTRSAPRIEAMPVVNVVLPAAESPTMPRMTGCVTALLIGISRVLPECRRGQPACEQLAFARAARDHQRLGTMPAAEQLHALKEEARGDAGGAEQRVKARMAQAEMI